MDLRRQYKRTTGLERVFEHVFRYANGERVKRVLSS
jgi:hypothetical protein